MRCVSTAESLSNVCGQSRHHHDGVAACHGCIPKAQEEPKVSFWLVKVLRVHLWKAESLVGTAASSGTASRVKPITTLQRGLASMDADAPLPPVQALALVRVGTVPLLAVAAGNAVDLWQIA